MDAFFSIIFIINIIIIKLHRSIACLGHAQVAICHIGSTELFDLHLVLILNIIVWLCNLY
jgi:hypothetical protein